MKAFAFALFFSAASAATLEWTSTTPGAEHVVHWRDSPGVVPGAADVVSVATGTATSAWIPNPPAGVSRYAVVTAHFPDEPMPMMYASRSAEVGWPLISFTFAVMTSTDLASWRVATEAVIKVIDNKITVTIPASGTAAFLHIRYDSSSKP